MNNPKQSLDISALESWLWEAACTIRGPVDAPRYKDYILPLVFLKRLSDVFEDEVRTLTDKYESEEMARQVVEADHTLVRFFMPQKARWGHVNRITQGLGEAVTDAVRAVARENPRLSGVIDVSDFNATTAGQRIVGDEQLHELVQVLSKHRLGLRDVEPDILGRAYEYLIRKFAEGQGQSAGEFYTPRMVGVLMAHLLDPEPGMTVYDPACGSGGLLIKSHLRIIDKYGEIRNDHTVLPTDVAALRAFGQEVNPSTFAMARMNSFIHDVEAEIAVGDTMRNPRFTTEAGGLLQFDLVAANPMWNQDFPTEIYESDQHERFVRGIPPASSGDWAWVQHILSSLRNSGRAAIVLDNGAAFRGSRGTQGNAERQIRSSIISQDLLEAVVLLPPNLFYNTDSHGIILILNKKKASSRFGKTILVNASREFRKGRPKNFLTNEAVKRISDAVLLFQETEGFARIVSAEEIGAEDYIVLPSWYVHIYPDVELAKPESINQAATNLITTSVKVERELRSILKSGDSWLPDSWELLRLGDLVQEFDERAGDREIAILSCSKIHGLILQSEKFNHRVASIDTSRYKLVPAEAFAFDPMLLWDGSIGRNNYNFPGIVSPAYTVFTIADDDIRGSLFEMVLRAATMRPQYEGISLGTNVRRRKASFPDFCELLVPIPSGPERKSLTDLITNLDEAIRLKQEISTLVLEANASRIGRLLSSTEAAKYDHRPDAA